MTDQTSETTPDGLDVAAARERYERAHDELDRMTGAPGGPGAAWRWSIPAEPDRDSDLLLAASLADIPLLLAALDEARREAEYEKAKHDECHHVFTLMEGDLNAAEARATAAESARDAAEGVVREVRVDILAVLDATEWDDWGGEKRLRDRLRAVLDRLAPVTTDATEGEACPHGHRAPENCGLCTGCDG